MTARSGARLRFLGLGLGALVSLAGCTPRASDSSRLDIAVSSDVALALDQVVVTISGGGRSTYSQTFPVVQPAGAPATVAPVIWQVVIPSLSATFVATIEARGMKSSDLLVTLTADATISPNTRIQVALALTNACRKITCPASKTCVDGICQQRPMFGPADGGTLDAPMDTARDTAMDADALPDLSAPVDGRDQGGETGGAENGDPCTTGAGCASGNCVENVCCDKPCAQACYSCRNALTASSPSGTCAVIASGKDDPQARCGAAGMPAMCGNTSHCDGKGACEKYGSATVCVAAACTAGSFKAASTCDGKGTCVAGATQDCKGFACSAADGCATTCATDAECVGGYCASSKTCAAKKIDGSACQGNNECVHGQCVTGICCESACTGLCLSCLNTDTGAASGLCKPVQSGGSSKGRCAMDATTCGHDGTCDGNGACRFQSSMTSCRAPTCSGGTAIRAAACDGAGACPPASMQACAPYVCSGNGCATGCSNSQCAAGAACINGTTCMTCGAGQTVCPNACTNTRTDPSNCGACGRVCPGGACVNGSCPCVLGADNLGSCVLQ